MKKSYIFAIIIFVIVLVALASVLVKQAPTVDVPARSAADHKNATYIIDGAPVTLVNGAAETAIPNSASKVATNYFGNEMVKDLNDDGRNDIVFLLTQNTGGSGTFYYAAAALNTEAGYVGSHAFLLGDRIAPQTTESGPGKQVIVNYLERAPGVPMTAPPSSGKSLRLMLDAGSLKFDEVVASFEGEADPSRMSLTMKTWKWVQAEYNDGTILRPKNDAFSLTFKNDGTFGATTDCNGVGGKYAATESTVTFSEMMSTRMFCEGSQEANFIKILENTGEYVFTSKGELVLNLKFDSGSVYFR